jgi:hypothetical protein
MSMDWMGDEKVEDGNVRASIIWMIDRILENEIVGQMDKTG